MIKRLSLTIVLLTAALVGCSMDDGIPSGVPVEGTIPDANRHDPDDGGEPVSGAKGCGYAFEDEKNEVKVRGFWKKMDGLWVSSVDGFTAKTDEYGQKIYSKTGFETDVQSGNFGFVSLNYYSILDSHGKSFDTRTYARSPISSTRVGTLIQGGWQAGYRFVETYDPEQDWCQTLLIKADQNELQVVGRVTTSGGGRRTPEEFLNKESLGIYRYKRQ